MPTGRRPRGRRAGRSSDRWSSSRSFPGRPTGRGSTGRRSPGRATCSASCARCSFAPEDLALVKGDPDGRRRFLDDLLVARAPRFAGVRSDYERVLKQRNTLLKCGSTGRKGDIRTLDVWDDHLAAVGAELLAGRLYLVHLLAPYVTRPTGRSRRARGTP